MLINNKLSLYFSTTTSTKQGRQKKTQADQHFSTHNLDSGQTFKHLSDALFITRVMNGISETLTEFLFGFCRTSGHH